MFVPNDTLSQRVSQHMGRPLTQEEALVLILAEIILEEEQESETTVSPQ